MNSNKRDRIALQKRIRDAEYEIAVLRGQGLPSRDDVEKLAERLGRKRRKGYGDYPTYRNELFPDLRSLTIPERLRKRFTAMNILNQLEEDIDAWRRRLNELGGPVEDE